MITFPEIWVLFLDFLKEMEERMIINIFLWVTAHASREKELLDNAIHSYELIKEKMTGINMRSSSMDECKCKEEGK
jgi:hypothetical protein